MIEITADDILVGIISGQETLSATISMYGSVKRQDSTDKEKSGDGT